jgi:hypothetical protein
MTDMTNPVVSCWWGGNTLDDLLNDVSASESQPLAKATMITSAAWGSKIHHQSCASWGQPLWHVGGKHETAGGQPGSAVLLLCLGTNDMTWRKDKSNTVKGGRALQSALPAPDASMSASNRLRQ